MTQECASVDIQANAIAIGQVYAILALAAAIKETDFSPQINVPAGGDYETNV